VNSLQLHPRAAPGDRLQVWLGAFDRVTAPALTWSLDGNPVVPTPRAPLAPARPEPRMASAGMRRTFTGVFEISGGSIFPGSFHRVEVRADDGSSARLDTRAMMTEVPAGFEWFNVLLVSCFHRDEDKQGYAGRLASSLPPFYKPHLSILLGDQVYLDLPTLRNFHSDVSWLANDFEHKYNHNWRGPDGYARLLSAAPSVSTPDDHEFWNDFPRRQIHIPPTWSEDGRGAWRDAASAMWRAYQAPIPSAGAGPAFTLDVLPLSFFVLDTRNDRQADASRALAPAMLAQFRTWTERLVGEGLFGVVASGQSFMDPRVRMSATDLTLATHGDYPDLVNALDSVVAAGLPLLLLSGDVHYGRVTRVVDSRSGRALLHEVISSPSSLVTTIFLDQVKTIGAAIGSIFGRKNPWPRHSDPGDPPPHFGSEVLGGRLAANAIHKQKGNMVAVLSFRRAGFGVELRVRYWPIDAKWSVDQPVEVTPIELRAS
jgi:hypothetical protein